jgi:FkbH-like protein
MDNTLWGGIVGEDGIAGIQLDHSAGADPYLRLQAFLKRLLEKGVLLTVVTKNNEADVREVFEKRQEMLLQWDDFVLIDANWQPKSDNISDQARELNLGLQNFCFLDDSPFERAEVAAALPEVIVPNLPEAADDVVGYLARSGPLVRVFECAATHTPNSCPVIAI